MKKKRKSKVYNKCLWCLKTHEEVEFSDKAHTVPKSLGGQRYNRNVCVSCNSYFGEKRDYKYSIEEALKETFNITRWRLMDTKTKRKVGNFKSRFFDLKFRKNKPRLVAKSSYRFDSKFQFELGRAFKRGFFKMYLEELQRQKDLGFESNYNPIREFARFNKGDIPMFYFIRSMGIIMSVKYEFETPEILFNKMGYLYTKNGYEEIEFMGHVFGFPIRPYSVASTKVYLTESLKLKNEDLSLFKGAVLVKKLDDIDWMLEVMNS